MMRGFFKLGVVGKVPGGMTDDPSALFGLSGMRQSLNNLFAALVAIATSGTNSTLTAAQAITPVIRLTSGASGGFTITLPATSAIIAAFGSAIPVDGTFGCPLEIVNDNVGQTGTVTAGDSSTTLTGTMTIATNTSRQFWLTITAPTTITIQNIGSKSL